MIHRKMAKESLAAFFGHLFIKSLNDCLDKNKTPIVYDCDKKSDIRY